MRPWRARSPPLIVWFAPPGTDFAAHVFQLHVYLRHGFALWTNYWYAGRYTFVGYSLLYYPLAALVGIRLLAVLSVAASTAAFTLVIRQAWGESTVWATRFFAVVAAASVVSAAFPYGLGLALALTALVAIARRHVALFGILAALTLAASPLAFLFLLVVLAAAAVSRTRREIATPAAIAASICALGLLIWRLFPDHGVYPFSLSELLAALVFCGFGVGAHVARRARADPVRALHRLRRRLRPRLPDPVHARRERRPPALRRAAAQRSDALAAPLAAAARRRGRVRASPSRGTSRPSSGASLASPTTPPRTPATGQPVVGYLHHALSPSYRVEVVGTADHWEAVYLPQAGIPIVRGWFRQDDFPQNEVLYDNLTPSTYLTWLHRLSVRYVVLTDAPPDYSARNEIALLESGRSGLSVIHVAPHAVVFAVPRPRPIVTGPGDPKVEALSESAITLASFPARPLPHRHPLHPVPALAALLRQRGEGRDDAALGGRRRDREAPVQPLDQGGTRRAHRKPDDV